MKYLILLIALVFSLCALGQQSITLLQPSEGSVWEGAKTYTITWEAQNINLVKIEFSANGGNTWQMVEDAYPALTNTYDWTAPGQPTDSARIRLSDTDNPAINSFSGLFTITDPYITLIQPPSLVEGNAYAIRWESSCIFHLDILFSTDNGQSWDTIYNMVNAPPGIKNWPVPEAAENCILKLVDSANPEMFSISEAFDIGAAPTINPVKYHGGSFDGYARCSNLTPELEILSPTGGETWDGSTEQWLTWHAENSFRILILFSTDGGSTWPDTLQNLYPAEALKYLITVPNTPTDQARFKLVSLDVPGLEAESGDFIIPEPFIEIQNDFTSVYAGTPYPIFWGSSGVAAVSIFYSADNATSWDTIALDVPANRGIQNWKVPEPTEEAWIRVSDSSGSILDEVGPFVIAELLAANTVKYQGGSFDGYARSSSVEPSLIVTNPTVGETWDGSTVQMLQWEAVNTFRLMILFSIDDGQTWPDTLQELYPAEAGKLDITIPNTPTNAARFKLLSLDIEGLEAISESFVIPEPFITITTDFQGLKTGTPYPIFWESSGVSHVNITYSPDGGTSWDTIGWHVPANRGIKNWKVSEPTTNGIVVVSDTLEILSDQVENISITELPQHNPTKYQGGSYDGYAQWWFKTADSNCPNDTTVCVCDPAFELSGAIPPGGSYSGPGVSNGIFNPALAGVGTHQIYYESTYINGTTICSFYITVFTPSMKANNDAGIPVNGNMGGVTVANVLINDSLNSLPVVPDEVSLVQISSSHPSVKLDPQSGEVYVDPGTPAGNYELVYEVCDNAFPNNCDQATVIVEVYEFPELTFCMNDQLAEAGVTLSFCSNQRIDFHVCAIQNGEAPFTICWELDGAVDCNLSVLQGDTLISEFFTQGTHSIKIISITDNIGATVIDLSPYDFDFNIVMGSESFAGNNNAICEGETFPLNNAYANGYSALQWTGGDGTFIPSSEVLNPEYIPGVQDITSGMADLCLTAYSIDPCTAPSVDCLSLAIQQEAIANAGSDIILCASDMYAEVQGFAENAAYIEWTSDSFTGFFADAGSLNTTYFFSAEDIDVGTVELCLHAIPQSPCLVMAMDCLQLSISLDPVASAGPDQTICEGESKELSLASVENTGNVEWSTSGDGTFNNSSMVPAIYYPGPNDVSQGSAQLCITAYPQTGCSNTVIDCLNLTIIETPEANLGGNRYLDCEDYDVENGQWFPVLIINSITEDYISLEWTTDGDGTFDNPSEVSPNYYPGLADRWNGEVELQLNIEWSSYCQFSSSQSQILHIPQQIIPFNANKWYGISSYLDPELETVAEVMEPMVLIPGSQYLVNMVDEQGRYYWPEPIPPQSTLGDWLPIGYKLKVKNTPACLPIYGDSLIDQTFLIEGSYTYLPVLSNVPAEIETLFAGHIDDILLIYDWADNQIWTPIASDFDQLIPGYAYLLINKFGFENYSIEFPEFVPDAPLLIQQQFAVSDDVIISPWNKTQETTFFRFYLFSDEASANLNPGDIIGAFNEQGECCGLTQYGANDDVFKLVVSVGDRITNFSNGNDDYEQINFRIYRPSSDEEFEISIVCDENFPNSAGKQDANLVSMVTDIIEDISSTTEPTNSIHIYPNPTTGLLHITGIDGGYSVEVFNSVQEAIFTKQLNGKDQIDLSAYPKGMYLIKITTNDFSITKKVVVN